MKNKFSDKGARGFGFGKLDAEARAFLKPDFDRKKQYGNLNKIVGQRATVGDFPGGKQEINAHLEGDE